MTVLGTALVALLVTWIGWALATRYLLQARDRVHAAELEREKDAHRATTRQLHDALAETSALQASANKLRDYLHERHGAPPYRNGDPCTVAIQVMEGLVDDLHGFDRPYYAPDDPPRPAPTEKLCRVNEPNLTEEEKKALGNIDMASSKLSDHCGGGALASLARHSARLLADEIVRLRKGEARQARPPTDFEKLCREYAERLTEALKANRT